MQLENHTCSHNITVYTNPHALNNNFIQVCFTFATVLPGIMSSFKKILFIIFYREGKGGKKRERNINVWLPLICPLLGIWSTTQACALTGN